MNEIECESCIKRKTIYCPSSSECYDTVDKPYYQNRIMLLKENQQLKEQLETSEKARIDAIELVNKVINMREICSKYDCMYKDDVLDVLRVLDIDKGE